MFAKRYGNVTTKTSLNVECVYLLTYLLATSSREWRCGACSSGGSDEATKRVLDELGVTNASASDLKLVHEICEVLSHRSASLVAAGGPYVS